MPYKRVLLKLSGELLGLNRHSIYQGGIDHNILVSIAHDIKTVVKASVQIAIVLGGGNWFRGAKKENPDLKRVTADQVGMLATLMNSLIFRDALANVGLEVKILSSIPITHMVEAFEWKAAQQYLDNGKVIILGGGTGHPFVSTDSAASLRALEIQADILLKATSVDGVYSADPRKHADARLYSHISYDQIIRDKLKVMDLAAFVQCRDFKLPVRIFNAQTKNSLVEIINGKAIGTLVSHL